MKLADLEGLVSPATCHSLVNLGGDVPPDQAIVELGAYRGKSTCALASITSAHVWTIDPWDLPGNVNGKHDFTSLETREAFERQVSAMGLTDKITDVQLFSQQAAAEWAGPPIGLLFIDADHSEEGVVSDYTAWRPHLADEAVVVFDDLDTPRNPGVRSGIERLGLHIEKTLPEHLAVIACQA